MSSMRIPALLCGLILLQVAFFAALTILTVNIHNRHMESALSRLQENSSIECRVNSGPQEYSLFQSSSHQLDGLKFDATE